jgi:nucleoside phosphorylase
MLDEEHADLERDAANNDENLYALGLIRGYNVAIVCLLAGWISNNLAAAVATQMRATFRKIWFRLMVGIGSGVLSAEADVWLGNVVVIQPDGTLAGVV